MTFICHYCVANVHISGIMVTKIVAYQECNLDQDWCLPRWLQQPQQEEGQHCPRGIDGGPPSGDDSSQSRPTLLMWSPHRPVWESYLERYPCPSTKFIVWLQIGCVWLGTLHIQPNQLPLDCNYELLWQWLRVEAWKEEAKASAQPDCWSVAWRPGIFFLWEEPYIL